MEPSTADRDGLNREIIDMIVAEGMIERAQLTPDATLQSLGIASVDVVLILMAIEEMAETAPDIARLSEPQDAAPAEQFFASLEDPVRRGRLQLRRDQRSPLCGRL